MPVPRAKSAFAATFALSLAVAIHPSASVHVFRDFQHLHAAQRTSPCAVHVYREQSLRVRKQSSALETQWLRGGGRGACDALHHEGRSPGPRE
ncbi:hypothetical protein DFH94DRAFT_784917 [Russula ochroleuca]|uniref:Secreted protein n=1 Tax=Russula ochroleuca TaxID=152965 RepID=A0A9P5JV25_9AGAM|nr:hypothetical protein DFH94DRAFT_784917 [Russula ochroleuca]